MSRARSSSWRRSSMVVLVLLVAAFGVATTSPVATADPLQPTVIPGVGRVEAPLDGPVDLDVPVALSAPSSDPVTVEWTTMYVPDAPELELGTQASPDDYGAVSGVVTFGAGQTSSHVTVPVTGGALAGPEYVVISFHHPSGALMGGFWGLGAGVIDPGPAIRCCGGLFVGIPVGGVTIDIPVTLNPPADHVVTVRWATAQLGDLIVTIQGMVLGVARQAPQGDYVSASGTLTFLPGETTAIASVTVLGCTCPPGGTIYYPQPVEVLWLTFADATGARIAESEYIGTLPGGHAVALQPAP